MLVIPAIDLLAGQVVRLQEGKRERATVYSPHPADVAAGFARDGARAIHVVDLDGAFAGRPENRQAIRDICRVPARIQVGGGVRDLITCEELLAAGAHSVVLGTVAVKQPQLVAEACRRWPGRVVIAVDARDGKVAIEGWAHLTGVDAIELATRMVEAGAAAILYTDIARDGLMGGPNVNATAQLARALAPVPVIASGGISRLDDLRALDAANVPACVVGRALYEGAFTLREALAAVLH